MQASSPFSLILSLSLSLSFTQGFGTEICIRRCELWQNESSKDTLMNLTVCTDDNQKIKANKTDLAVESEYFRAMLTHAVRVGARPVGERKSR